MSSEYICKKIVLRISEQKEKVATEKTYVRF
jgi:hypothetical protein